MKKLYIIPAIFLALNLYGMVFSESVFACGFRNTFKEISFFGLFFNENDLDIRIQFARNPDFSLGSLPGFIVAMLSYFLPIASISIIAEHEKIKKTS